MGRITSGLTVYFDDPFWVGVYERTTDGMLEVARITFGAEPTDHELWDYLLHHWHRLQFSPQIQVDEADSVAINPKRLQREARKQMSASGVGTKAQQALKLQREENKATRKQQSKRTREAEQQARFESRQRKRKQKHRGH